MLLRQPSLLLLGRYQRRLLASSSPLKTKANATAKRPISPHITIYQPQLTWLMSIGHRVSGAGLACAIYAWAITASIAPSNLTSTAVSFLAQTVPEPLFIAGKVVLAFPFSYHLWNGLRHLAWDAGFALTLRGVYATGWAVNGATLLSTAALLYL